MMFTLDERNVINNLKTTIKGYVERKLNDPMFTAELTEFLVKNCVLSGGISASVLSLEKPNDYDLYFKSVSAIEEFKKLMEKDKRTIKNLIKDVDVSYYTSTLVSGKLITANAYTFFNDVQVIVLDTMQAIESFDFIHCQPYLDISDDKYYISKHQFDCIMNRKLVYNPNRKYNDKPNRLEKFKARGWKL